MEPPLPLAVPVSVWWSELTVMVPDANALSSAVEVLVSALATTFRVSRSGENPPATLNMPGLLFTVVDRAA